MAASMTAKEYVGWLVFYHHEKYDPSGMDLRFGKLMAVIAHAVGNDKAEPSDFFQNLRESTKRQGTAAIDAALVALIPRQGR